MNMTEPWIECEYGLDADNEGVSVSDILYDVLTGLALGRVIYRDNDFGVLIRSWENH